MIRDRFSRFKQVVREKATDIKEEVRTFDPRLPADEVLRTAAKAVDGLERGARSLAVKADRLSYGLQNRAHDIDQLRGRIAGFDREAAIERAKAKVQEAKDTIRRNITF